jgi:hypothetical protein
VQVDGPNAAVSALIRYLAGLMGRLDSSDETRRKKTKGQKTRIAVPGRHGTSERDRAYVQYSARPT